MPEELPWWFASFPGGRAVIYADLKPRDPAAVEFNQAFRSRAIVVVDRRQSLSFPQQPAGGPGGIPGANVPVASFLIEGD